MPLIGRELATDLGAIRFGLTVEVLVAVASAKGDHVHHPEVVGIGADGMDGLLEADLDFEPPAVESDDRQGLQRGVGGQEDELTAGGVIDQDETDQPAQRSPQQVQAAARQPPIAWTSKATAWQECPMMKVGLVFPADS